MGGVAAGRRRRAGSRGRRADPGKLKGRLRLLLGGLLLFFCCVITAGEYFGWPTPRWAEVMAWLQLDDPPAFVTDGDTELHFIDVGQADATLIRQGGSYALIDAGDWGDGDALVEYLKQAGVTRLDCVVMTHPHADHIGGMPEVLQSFEVGLFLLPDFSLLPKPPSSALLTRTLEELQRQQANGCVVQTAARRQKIPLGAGSLQVLLAGVEGENLNNLSICLKFSADGLDCLFTGDGEREVERELLAVEPDLRADLFQAGHHGSSSSNTAKLLAAVDPQYVIISCGQDNSYGHPHREVLQLLSEMQVQVLRTDQLGSIVFSVKGDAGLQIFTEKEAA